MGLCINGLTSLGQCFLIWQRGIPWRGCGVAAQPQLLWASKSAGLVQGLGTKGRGVWLRSRKLRALRLTRT